MALLLIAIYPKWGLRARCRYALLLEIRRSEEIRILIDERRNTDAVVLASIIVT